MPAFLIMGGFVAAPMLDRLGPAEFARSRTRRLLLPFLFGCVLILPLDFYIWLLGWVIDDRIPMKKLRSLKLGPAAQDLWGVGHLWFLQYLLLFSLAAAAIAARRSGARIRPAFPRLSSRWELVLVPVLFALPGALVLYFQPRIVIGFRHSWHPLPANLLYYAPCFAAGWWLQRRAREGTDFTRTAWLHLGFSVIAFAVLLPWVRQHVIAEWSGTDRLRLTALFSAFAWLSAWGGVCLSLKPCPPPPRWVGYLSASSLWIYLAHHPAVGLAQVALMRVPLAPAAKFAITFAAATALSLLTYEACVRRTWIGALLNGRRETRSTSADPAAAVSTVRRAA